MQVMNGQAPPVKSIVPLPAGGVAVFSATGEYFYHPDHLGSFRFASSSNRTMYFDLAHAPFGETYANSGTTDPAFTGQRQDTVSGLYDFPAREYSIQGRWTSPDPAGLAAVDPSNPQSWNRYAYVTKNPLGLVDPAGLCGTDFIHNDKQWGNYTPGRTSRRLSVPRSSAVADHHKFCLHPLRHLQSIRRRSCEDRRWRHKQRHRPGRQQHPR